GCARSHFECPHHRMHIASPARRIYLARRTKAVPCRPIATRTGFSGTLLLWHLQVVANQTILTLALANHQPMPADGLFRAVRPSRGRRPGALRDGGLGDRKGGPPNDVWRIQAPSG